MKEILCFLLVLVTAVTFGYSQSEDENIDRLSKVQDVQAKDFYSDDVVFDTDSLYQIIMKNGTSYIGAILEENDKELKILSHEIGEITLSKAYVESIELISEIEYQEGNIGSQTQIDEKFIFTNWLWS
jgi:uncharacterized protein (UPF0128 family)